MDYSEEQLSDTFGLLPEDIKKAIVSVDSAQKIRAIADKYSLHIDQAGELGAETGLVLLGETAPQDFLGNVTRELKISPELAGEIIKDVNAQIFFPVRDSLRLVQEQNQVAKLANQNIIPKQVSQADEAKSVFDKRMSDLFSSSTDQTKNSRSAGPDPYHEPI